MRNTNKFAPDHSRPTNSDQRQGLQERSRSGRPSRFLDIDGLPFVSAPIDTMLPAGE